MKKHMLKMNSTKILLALLGILTSLILFQFAKNIAFPAAQTLTGDLIQKILPGQTFSQQFITESDSIEAIQVLLRTPGIKTGDTLKAQLADATCATIIREGTLETTFLNADNLYQFSFPRVEQAQGKEFCLTLSFRATKNGSKYLRFFTTPTNDSARLFTDISTHAPLNGEALALRTVSRNNSLWSDLRELNQRISQYKPWFLKDLFIGSIAVFFIILSLGLITTLILFRPKEDEEER